MQIEKFLIGGNWKMNGSLNLIAQLSHLINNATWDTSNIGVIVAPPFPLLAAARSAFDKKIHIAGQNMSDQENGAYTGEVSFNMLKEVGCDWVILGHSERRTLFQESDEVIARKVLKAIQKGIKVILCIGEPKQIRESEQTEKYICSQLSNIFSAKEISSFSNLYDRLVIAYEPIWAIGTGIVASPAQAQEIHHFIRRWMMDNVNDNMKYIRILYGGSVSSSNCTLLAQQPDINGFLVGGASIKDEFLSIIQAGTMKSQL